MEMTNMFCRYMLSSASCTTVPHSLLSLCRLCAILHFYKWTFRPWGGLKHSHSSVFEAAHWNIEFMFTEGTLKHFTAWSLSKYPFFMAGKTLMLCIFVDSLCKLFFFNSFVRNSRSPIGYVSLHVRGVTILQYWQKSWEIKMKYWYCVNGTYVACSIKTSDM